MTQLVDVILVEDSKTDAELTVRELRKHYPDLMLVHFRNGEEVLYQLLGDEQPGKPKVIVGSPKLLLLDIQMPKVNGLEVLQQLKADSRTRMIPVVILTSSKESPDIKRCYELGANSYIVKPVSFEGFTKAIREVGMYWLVQNQSPR